MKKIIISMISILCLVMMSGCNEEKTPLDEIKDKADDVMDDYYYDEIDSKEARYQLGEIYKEIVDIDANEEEKDEVRGYVLNYSANELD